MDAAVIHYLLEAPLDWTNPAPDSLGFCLSPRGQLRCGVSCAQVTRTVLTLKVQQEKHDMGAIDSQNSTQSGIGLRKSSVRRVLAVPVRPDPALTTAELPFVLPKMYGQM